MGLFFSRRKKERNPDKLFDSEESSKAQQPSAVPFTVENDDTVITPTAPHAATGAPLPQDDMPPALTGQDGTENQLQFPWSDFQSEQSAETEDDFAPDTADHSTAPQQEPSIQESSSSLPELHQTPNGEIIDTDRLILAYLDDTDPEVAAKRAEKEALRQQKIAEKAARRHGKKSKQEDSDLSEQPAEANDAPQADTATDLYGDGDTVEPTVTDIPDAPLQQDSDAPFVSTSDTRTPDQAPADGAPDAPQAADLTDASASFDASVTDETPQAPDSAVAQSDENSEEETEEETPEQETPVPEISEQSFDFAAEETTDNEEEEEAEEATPSLFHRKKWTRRGKILLLAGSAVALIAAAIALLLFGCRIKTVTFHNLSYYEPKDVVERLGIEKNDFLLLLSKRKIEHVIAQEYPYIHSVQITRELPDNLVITVKQDTPMFYTEILGDYFVISSNLRVLKRYDSEEEIDSKLIRLSTAQVSSAIVGEQIQFEDETYFAYLQDYIARLMDTAVAEHITEMDLTYRSRSSFVYDDRLKVILGTSTDFETKMLFFEGILGKLKDTDRGTVNLLNVQEASVALDNTAAAASDS